jgi:hypothetical protein
MAQATLVHGLKSVANILNVYFFPFIFYS